MENDDDKRQQLLLEIMTDTGATSPDSTDELLRPWRRLAANLSPLIGESGFCALHLRATRLVAGRFEWLAAAQSCKSIERALEALGATYGSQEPPAARAGNAALLDTFTRLLSDLIGQALTMRLLHSALNGDVGQKNAQEHKYDR